MSANKADFWQKKDNGYDERLHQDLQAEADLAGLEFYARLEAALQALGI